jgi:hypothetical protein
MKQTVVILLLALGICAQAQTNFYTNVTNLWFAGHKTNVLAVANQRLQQNTNDIAGLLLKMSYETEFLQFDQISNTMDRVVQAGAAITTPKFAALYPVLAESANYWKTLIPVYPADQIGPDRAKGSINEKPLAVDFILEALQEDGYFQ